MLNSASVCRCLRFEIRTIAAGVICLLRRVTGGLMRSENGFRVKDTIYELRHKRYHANTPRIYVCLSVSPVRNRITQRQIRNASLFELHTTVIMKSLVLHTVMLCSLVNKEEGGCVSWHSYPFATQLSLQHEKGNSLFLRNACIHISNYTQQKTADLKLGLLHVIVAADHVAAISCNKINTRGCPVCVVWPKQNTAEQVRLFPNPYTAYRPRHYFHQRLQKAAATTNC